MAPVLTLARSVPEPEGQSLCCIEVTPGSENLETGPKTGDLRQNSYSLMARYVKSGVGGVASTPPMRSFSYAYGKIKIRMETKENTMSKSKVLMGTVCAIALAAGPAAADTLTGFAGFARADFQHQTFQDNYLGGPVDSVNGAKFGIGGALPVTGIPNLNVQVDASYQTRWTNEYNHFSPNYCTPPATFGTPCAANHADTAVVWNFGFSPFLAYAGSRWGMNLNYETVTRLGHVTNGGGFMEWYLDDAITIGAKAGYLHSGGTPQGGHGHYLAGQALFYAMPNLALSLAVAWNQVLTGGAGAQGFPVCPRSCMLGANGVFYTVEGEWLVSEDYGISALGSYTYSQDNRFTVENNANIFRVGLKYYTGMGPLVDRHRNGVLRDWLRTSLN